MGRDEEKKRIPEGPQAGGEARILVGEAGGQSFLLTSPQGIKGAVGKNGNERMSDALMNSRLQIPLLGWAAAPS